MGRASSSSRAERDVSRPAGVTIDLRSVLTASSALTRLVVPDTTVFEPVRMPESVVSIGARSDWTRALTAAVSAPTLSSVLETWVVTTEEQGE